MEADEAYKKRTIISEIKLDLMDWKTIESTAEEQIRENLAKVRLHELARREAKKMIKSFNGKTSEEERREGKKRTEKEREATV